MAIMDDLIAFRAAIRLFKKSLEQVPRGYIKNAKEKQESTN